jgi:starch synthase (maltosyl-transferring)
MVPMSGRIHIDEIMPTVSGGRYPAKAVTDEHVPIAATVWREGHDAVAATVVWRGPADENARATPMTRVDPGGDLWTGTIVVDRPGLWTFRVDAWSDPWTTWRDAVRAKLAAGQGPGELANDLAAGAILLCDAARQAAPVDRTVLLDAAAGLSDGRRSPAERVAAALAGPVCSLLLAKPVRELVTEGATYQLRVDRPRAGYGAWYEFFPRSTGGRRMDGQPVHGTFATATKALDRIAAMNFDVVYLPPIHPIGVTNRKGRNNSLVARRDDVGSPWAIGSAEGGHDAIHPELGTIEDFRTFVRRCRELGMEVALDLALQCAPDHPWVGEHPEWFTTRPDGSIAYAENPPKKYQDIYPLNFDNDTAGLRVEILRVVRYWVAQGVRIFRVDNPHTKPPDFWHWLIDQVKSTCPDVLFLAEAFTSPARLYGLARLGFDQSYTYFTWRDSKRELAEFGRELVAHAHEGRPNLFVTTPDILPLGLHGATPAMFALRAVLAATLAPAWGIYSGYELYEHTPREPGSEEHSRSEKYELRPREFAAALAGGRSLQPWLARLNEIRRRHPALSRLRTLRFHDIDNDALIAYSKSDPETGDTVVCVVNLDPDRPQEGVLRLDLDATAEQEVTVHDEVTGETWHWGAENYVRLDPALAAAHIVAVAVGGAGRSHRGA